MATDDYKDAIPGVMFGGMDDRSIAEVVYQRLVDCGDIDRVKARGGRDFVESYLDEIFPIYRERLDAGYSLARIVVDLARAIDEAIDGMDEDDAYDAAH